MNPKWKTYENKAYEAWIRKKECLVCKGRPSDVHHTWNTGRKNGGNSYCGVPLCRQHHTMGNASYHHLEKERFEQHHNLNLEWEIINFLSQYIHETEAK